MTTTLSHEQVSAETCKIVDEKCKDEVENQVDLDDTEEDDDEEDDEDDDAPAKKEAAPIDPTNKTSYIYQKKAEKARWSEAEVFKIVNRVIFVHSLFVLIFLCRHIRTWFLLTLSKNMKERIGN